MTNDLQAIVLLNTAIKIGTRIRVFIKGMKKCLIFFFFNPDLENVTGEKSWHLYLIGTLQD